MGSTRRSFTEEYKQQAVEFVLEQGRPITEVARNIGCHEMTLGNRVRKERDTRESRRVDINEALTEFRKACQVSDVNGVVGITDFRVYRWGLMRSG